MRAAIRGTLGTTDLDTLPQIDLEWRGRWTSLADLGITSFCVPEEQGGFGLNVAAAVATASELGAALHASPFAGITAATRSLAEHDDAECSDLVAALISGVSVAAFGRLGADGVARTVDGAADADALLLVDGDADTMMLITDRAAWTSLPARPSFDVSRACADLAIDSSLARRIPTSYVARDLHGLLLAADSLGGVQRMLGRTVTYAGQRQAFGRPIGGFQAVQHRLVDHTVRIRGMALLITEAARQLATGDPGAHRSVVLAELAVSSGAVHVLHDLLQISGAIGFTWEYGLHHYERRAHQTARLAANPRAATRALAAVEGWS